MVMGTIHREDLILLLVELLKENIRLQRVITDAQRRKRVAAVSFDTAVLERVQRAVDESSTKIGDSDKSQLVRNESSYRHFAKVISITFVFIVICFMPQHKVNQNEVCHIEMRSFDEDVVTTTEVDFIVNDDLHIDLFDRISKEYDFTLKSN